LNKNGTSIQELLVEHWSEDDSLDPTDKCEQCNERGQRCKMDVPTTMPKVLVLTLKRWDVVQMSPLRMEKINKVIHYELDLLLPQQRKDYKLRSVVVHGGDAGGGHYTAYFRGDKNDWYFCDDGQAPRASTAQYALNANAYMLFYEEA
jgi:ubiquitin C-terminal hydrolase